MINDSICAFSENIDKFETALSMRQPIRLLWDDDLRILDIL